MDVMAARDAPVVRLLRVADVPAFQALRHRALTEHPDAFLATPQTDRALQPGFMAQALDDEAHQAVFGAFLGEDLVGCAGLLRESGPKTRHRATLWGMYVVPTARRRGAGRALVEFVLAHAASWDGVLQVRLCVSESASAARALYESAGFRTWGREPAALRLGDVLIDEDHMARPVP